MHAFLSRTQAHRCQWHRLLLPAAHFHAGAFAAQHGHRWKSISLQQGDLSFNSTSAANSCPCHAQEPGAKAPVIVAGKDQGEVDNDYLLIPVNILDHEGPLRAAFPVENRLLPQSALPALPC